MKWALKWWAFLVLEMDVEGSPNPGTARHVPGLDVEGEWFSAAPPVVRLAFSTSFFHFFTISFAVSDTRLSACDRSFPTARPALLSCRQMQPGEIGWYRSDGDGWLTLRTASFMFGCFFKACKISTTA